MDATLDGPQTADMVACASGRRDDAPSRRMTLLCDGGATSWTFHGWEPMQYIRHYSTGARIYACAQCGFSLLVRDD